MPTTNYDMSSSIHLIQGAPGSGKTSLLKQIKKDLRDREITYLRATGSSLGSVESFLDVLANDLPQISILRTKETATRRVTGGVPSVAQAENEWGSEKRRSPVWELIQRALNTRSKKLIVLCVDEIQNTPSLVDRERNTLLDDLSLGLTLQLRILPIFAGLSDSRDVLRRAGISRLNQEFVFSLGRMESDDAEMVVQKSITHAGFGLEGAFSAKNLTYISKLLAKVSDGWPRHLDFYVKGVLSELAKDQATENPQCKFDFNAVLDHGNRARVAYYEELVSSFGVREPEFLKILTANLDVSGRIAYSDVREGAVNKGISREGVIATWEEAIHVGLLEPISQNPVGPNHKVPIPSLATYVRNSYSNEATLVDLQHDAEKTKAELKA